jgi:hypothetical protein
MSKEIFGRVTKAYMIVDQDIENFGEQRKLLAGRVRYRKGLKMIMNSVKSAPAVLSDVEDEMMENYLKKASEDLSREERIPKPSSAYGTAISTAGSAIPIAFKYYVARVGVEYKDNAEVQCWVRVVDHDVKEYFDEEIRSEDIRQRLSLMHPTLVQYYDEAEEWCLSAEGVKDKRPVGATQNLARLLDQFKGSLLELCGGCGEGKTYLRISECLAANSILSKAVVADGGTTEKRIKDELVEIRKNLGETSGVRMVEIFREIEGHIISITDALDPDKVKINFKPG